MDEGIRFEGGCLCGRVRYRSERRPLDSGYCHCRICQRSTGAPVLAWAAFPVEAFVYIGTTPSIYRSSARGQREFCAECGTQIAFREFSDGGTVDVNFVTLDDPERLEPQYHIWTRSRLRWFDTADQLPRYDGEGPEPDQN
jgi:hypothetical protein